MRVWSGFRSVQAVALYKFPGRGVVSLLLNTFMGLPPVVVGLIVFLMLSRSGPLGVLGLLFTPTAMIIAQAILVTPIVAALTRQIVEDLWREYGDHLRSLNAGPIDTLGTLIYDARFSLATVVLAGFGRAIAEVGAVMIVGGQYRPRDPCDDDRDCAGNLQGQSRHRAGAGDRAAGDRACR